MSTNNQPKECYPYAQSLTPLPDARAESESGGAPKEDCHHWVEINTRYPERSMVLDAASTTHTGLH